MSWPPKWWPWQPKPTPPSPTPSPPGPVGDITRKLLDAHNRERQKHGKGQLRINLTLQAFSQAHANTMVRNAKMSHDWAGDGSFSSRIQQSGYSYLSAGENIAWNQQNVFEVMTAWMNSPGHLANILGDFSECGLAVAYGVDHDPYWSSVFCQPGTGMVPLIQSGSPDGLYIKAVYGYLNRNECLPK